VGFEEVAGRKIAEHEQAGMEAECRKGGLACCQDFISEHRDVNLNSFPNRKQSQFEF